MNTLDTLYSRKSIRNYTGEQISAEELDILLKSAYASPISMGKYEDMHITIIQKNDLLTKIDVACAALYNRPEMHPIYNVPTLIIISSKAPEKMRENSAFSNGAIVAHNMVLAATELGLGACYLWGATAAISMNPELKAELNLPEGYILCSSVGFGKTNEVYSVREIPADKISKNIIL